MSTPTAVSAEEVLAAAASAYRVELAERLIAAYALGSLAHGGFSPLVSDIDLGLIVGDPLRADDAERIEVIANAQKASKLPLADRLSVFWGSPTPSELFESPRSPRLRHFLDQML